MADQAVTVYEKLVALGLAAENRMIVEHEAAFSRPGLTLENQGRSQTADTSAHDHAVIDFSRVDYTRGKGLKGAVANLVTGLEHCCRIAIGIRVFADTAVTGPVIDYRTCGRIRGYFRQ